MPEIEIHYPDGLVGYKTLSTDAPLVVGSGSGCDVQLDAPNVSKKHFLFRWSNSGNTWRFDVGKELDGVQLNGRPSGGDALGADDEVSLGDYTFIFRDSSAPRRGVQEAPAIRPVVMMNYDERDYYTPLLQQKTFRTILGTILTVAIIGGVSYFGFHATRADKMFNAAKKNLDEGNYEKALNEFKDFRDNYPSDRRAPKARVFQDVATIHGLLQSGQQYGAALMAAEKTLKDNDKSPAMRDPEVPPALIKPLIETGRGAADRAKDVRSRIDTDALRVAKAALQLAERVGPREGVLATEYDAAMELTGKATAAIEKETLRRDAVGKMQAAIDAKKPMVVYAEHRDLYQRYPDLKLDADALAKRAEARKIEQSMTTFKPAQGGAAKAAKRAEPAPARVPINRTPLGEAKPSEKIAVVQAADTIVGLDTGSGEVKWSSPVGFDPAFAPQAVEDGVLVHRTLDRALALVDPANGYEKWSTPLESKVLRYISRPLAYQGRVYISGFDGSDETFGRLYVFNLRDGRYQGEVVFPQKLAGMPVLDKKRNTLLIPGDQATMYAVNPSNNQCSAVYQMGHEPGTLAWVPMLAGRFLFSIENYAPGKSTLRVFVLSGEDGSLRERNIGELSQLAGSVRRDPILVGTRLFITTDRDAFQAFDLGGEDDERPIQLAARNIPPVAVKQATDAPYPVAPTDRQFWTAGSTLRYYQVRGGGGDVNAAEKFELDGPPAIPPILEGETLIVGNRLNEGKVRIQAMDVPNRKWKWRLELVQPPKAAQKDPAKDGSLLLTLATGATISVPIADLLKKEPLVLPDAPAERPAEAELNFEDVPGWSEGVVQWAGVGRREMRSFPRSKPAKQFALAFPAAAVPGVFGKGLIVPCQDGLVYWIDPVTGGDLAEPFGVSFVDGKPVDLGTGVGVAEDAAVVIAGTSLIRLQLERKGFPHFKEQTRIEIPDAPDTFKVDPAVLRRWLASVHLAKVGDRILVSAGKNVYRVRSEDLVVEKTIPIGGNCAAPPTRIGALAIFSTDRRELAAFGSVDGKQPPDLRWKLKLTRAPLGTPKAVGDDAFWLAYADGRLVEHAASDGKQKRELDAGRNLIDGPWFVADRLLVVTPVGGLAALEIR
jgi:hypothetical protein